MFQVMAYDKAETFNKIKFSIFVVVLFVINKSSFMAFKEFLP